MIISLKKKIGKILHFKIKLCLLKFIMSFDKFLNILDLMC